MTIVTHSVGGFSVTCNAEAFAWYLRAIAAGMPLGGINSDYRDPAEQERLFRARYRLATGPNDRGPFGDRRNWLGQAWVRTSSAGPVAPPGSSEHEKGLAIDFAQLQRDWLARNPQFGWRRPRRADGSFSIPSEPWHYEWRLAWVTITAPTKEDDMFSDADRRRQANIESNSILAAKRSDDALKRLQRIDPIVQSIPDAVAELRAVVESLPRETGRDSVGLYDSTLRILKRVGGTKNKSTFREAAAPYAMGAQAAGEKAVDLLEAIEVKLDRILKEKP